MDAPGVCDRRLFRARHCAHWSTALVQCFGWPTAGPRRQPRLDRAGMLPDVVVASADHAERSAVRRSAPPPGAATSPSSEWSAATAAGVSPASRAAAAVTGPMHTTVAGTATAAGGGDEAAHGRARGEHDGVRRGGASEHGRFDGGRDRPVGHHGVHRPPLVPQPLDEHRPGRLGLGHQARDRARQGTRRARPSATNRSGTRSTASPSCAQASAVPGPTTASFGPGRGQPPAGSAAARRRAPLGDVTTTQSVSSSRAAAAARPAPPSAGSDDGDHRHLDDVGSQRLQAVDQAAGLLGGAGHHHGPSRERTTARVDVACHGTRHDQASTSWHRSSQHCVVRASEATSIRSSWPWNRVAKSS